MYGPSCLLNHGSINGLYDQGKACLFFLIAIHCDNLSHIPHVACEHLIVYRIACRKDLLESPPTPHFFHMVGIISTQSISLIRPVKSAISICICHFGGCEFV